MESGYIRKTNRNDFLSESITEQYFSLLPVEQDEKRVRTSENIADTASDILIEDINYSASSCIEVVSNIAEAEDGAVANKKCKLLSKSKLFIPDKDEMAILKQAWYSNKMDNYDMVWNTNFDAVLEYCCLHGHGNIPYHLVCQMPDGKMIRLGLWLYNQRQQRSKGTLKESRYLSLQSLVDKGRLSWYIGPTDDEKWDQMFRFILDYGECNNGDCNVPAKFELQLSDGSMLKLGLWLTKQRQLKKKSILRIDRVERLQALVDVNKLKWGFKDSDV